MAEVNSHSGRLHHFDLKIIELAENACHDQTPFLTFRVINVEGIKTYNSIRKINAKII